VKHIYVNGKVYTGELPLVQAFGEEEGKFVFAGSDEEAAALAEPGDKVTDLQGRFVCSGFNDSHMHLLSYGSSLSAARLAAHTGSLKEMLQYFKQFKTAHPVPENGWLMGRGWNQDYFTDTDRMPDRHDLDQVSDTVLVCAVRACGHCLTVNTKALEFLGVTADTPQPEGGRIGMDENGSDGRFFDSAMDQVYHAVLPPDKEEIKRRIRLACCALNSYGITSCQTDDYCVYRDIPWQTVNEAYRELEKAGELTVRVYEQCNFTETADVKGFVEAGNITGAGTEYFKLGPLKLLGDGALGARTAYLSRPYADAPSARGIPVFSQETLDEMIGYANAVGMQTAVHAIGDACLDRVLAAYEKALKEHPRKDHRHGIVHCQITRPDQLKKIAQMGLHVYAQSIFLDYDNHIVKERVGEELAATSYSWKTLMNMGVSVSNGTDCPVEVPDALASMECAVTRTSLKDHTGPYLPKEAFSVKEALDSYTIRGAEASFEEGIKGKICPGMLADFVVLEQSPFEVKPENIHRISVYGTYLGGKKVFG